MKPMAASTRESLLAYELIARHYIAQFYPHFEFHQTQIEIDVAGVRFGRAGDSRSQRAGAA
jgi:DNA topoisomerase IA